MPHNLSLIVAGKLSSGTFSLLDIVQRKVETRILEHGHGKGPHPPGWKRPFVDTPSANRPPIKETIKKTVEFPERDESGLLYRHYAVHSHSVVRHGRNHTVFPWAGPKCIS